MLRKDIAEKILSIFYTEYLEWTKTGGHPGCCFNRGSGLCCNLYDWANTKGFLEENRDDLLILMHMQFEEVGLNGDFPFNDSYKDYKHEYNNGIGYKNPQRIAWVESHLKGFSWGDFTEEEMAV